MKNQFLTILLTVVHLSVASQSLFYFDYQIDASKFKKLEEMNATAEKDYEDYILFAPPLIPLANSEAKELLAKKSQIDLDNKGEIRVYIKFNSSYDTLKVLGYSSVYYSNDKPIIFYMLHLLAIEHNTKPSTYMSITEILYYAFRNYMKSNEENRLISLEYGLQSDFKIFKPCFYMFTEAEWNLYTVPFDKESILEDRRGAHKFISNSDSIDISYHKFPYPEKIKFTLKTKIDLEPKIKYDQYQFTSDEMTNMIVTLDFIQVGLEFKSDSITKSFWAFKEDLNYFINTNRTFRMACQLYFSSAIRNKFIPIDQ